MKLLQELLFEGAFVVLSRDGVEKRFKDDKSPAAKAWAETVVRKPKAEPKMTMPKIDMKLKPIDRENQRDIDEIDKIVKDQMKGVKEYDWSLRKNTVVDRDGVKCAAATVRIAYEITPEDDMGVEEVTEDSVTIVVARNPKKPSKLEFVRYA